MKAGESETEKEMIYLGNGTYCCFLDLSDEYKSSVMYQHLTGTASACYKICAEEEEAYKIGVSNICIGADALRQAYQQARMMIKNSFYERMELPIMKQIERWEKNFRKKQKHFWRRQSC